MENFKTSDLTCGTARRVKTLTVRDSAGAPFSGLLVTSEKDGVLSCLDVETGEDVLLKYDDGIPVTIREPCDNMNAPSGLADALFEARRSWEYEQMEFVFREKDADENGRSESYTPKTRHKAP